MSENMIFCLGNYEVKGDGFQKNNHIFNIEVSDLVYKKCMDSKPSFSLPITKWIYKEDMTEDEKEKWTSYTKTGGYLKTLPYKEAWKEGWATASQEFKDWVKNLPNFNSELFKKITGINFENDVKEMTVSDISKALGYDVKIIK